MNTGDMKASVLPGHRQPRSAKMVNTAEATSPIPRTTCNSGRRTWNRPRPERASIHTTAIATNTM